MKNYFSYKGGKIYFESVGEGQPIVFIHGFSLDSRMWKNQVDFFNKKYKVITYDMRGYGKSSIPKIKHSHHDDLRALLDYLDVSKIHLVGLSLGGEVASDFAVTYPDRLLSLTLVDSSVGGYPNTVDWDVGAKEEGVESAKMNWLNHSVFQVTKTNKKVFWELKKMVNDYSGWQWLNSGFKDKVKPQPFYQLDKINCPSLIVVGENDLPYFHSIAKVLEEKIKDSRKKIVRNSGHMVNMEAPEEFNGLLYNFLNSVSS